MAGRIPQDFIDDLLARTDIVDLVESRLKLRRTGRNYSALCPFHQEKSPSFSVNPEKQFYYCFGCGAAGNAIGFLMEYERLEFPQAVEELAKRVGLEVPQDGASRPAENHKPLLDLLESANRFYQQQLRQHPDRERAVSYLKGRGLSGSIAKRFAIGFAPPGWDNLLKHLGADSQRRNELDKAGLLILKQEEGKAYDRFRDRIIFPIHNQRGQVIAFGGRVLNDEKPKYLNSPETPVFHKNRELYGLYQARQANRQLQRVLIVEGYMDVVALAQHGISNAVATLGTATSEHHLTRLFKMCPEVVFCFDGDEAGRAAAKRALDTALPLMEDGRQARFLFLPEGQDPDSLVRQEGAEGFNQRLLAATPLPDFFFDLLQEGLNMEALDGRARLSALASPLLARLPQGVLAQLMQQRLTELTGLQTPLSTPAAQTPEPPASFAPDYDDGYAPADDYDTWPSEPAPRYTPGARSRRAERGHRDRPLSQTGSLFHKAIELLLRKPALACRVGLEASEALSRIEDPLAPLLVELLASLQQSPDTPTAVLLARWYDTPYWTQLSALAGKEPLLGDDSLDSPFMDCIQRLLDLELDAALNHLLKKRQSTPLTEKEKVQLTELLTRRASPKIQSREKP